MQAPEALPGGFMGVILAAGKGTRIQPFSESTPKPMLPILDKPLILWQVEAMRELGIRDIVIVIGHLGHEVVSGLGNGEAHGVKLRYVEQEHTLGIAHAVAQLEPVVDRPFLLFLGDIFFETKGLEAMLEAYASDGVDAVLAVKVEENPAALRRNFTVEEDAAGAVQRVIEKPRHPRTNLKGCGLYLFAPTIFDAVRRTPRTALRDEYELTDAIQILIDYGYGVRAARVIERDLNLSTPEDLLALNLHVLGADGRYVAESARLAEDAEVIDTVVMRDARIESGARLERCLVMPGETVRKGSYADVIFVGGDEIACHA